MQMQRYPFEPKSFSCLPDGLEPLFPSCLMEDHYKQHYLPMIEQLNCCLKEFPALHKAVLGELLCFPSRIPPNCREQVLRAAGGVHCHQVFFSSLCPPGKRTVPDRVSKALCQCFGSFQQFQEQFDKAACHFFGSGFVWLVMLPTNYRLVIRISYGYEIPLSEGGCPLLCLDLWEHAYCRCLTLQEYLKAWWCLVNWNVVENRMLSGLCHLR